MSDDAAVIGGDLAGAVTEDAQQTETSGTLTVSDPDAGQSAFTAQTKAGRYGTFTLGTDGEWTYTLHNADPDTDALGAGQKVTDTFEVASVDGTTAQVVVTVTGADDAAVIDVASLTGAVTEDAQQTATASGTLTVSDVDTALTEAAAAVHTADGGGGEVRDVRTLGDGRGGGRTRCTTRTRIPMRWGAGQKVTDTFEVASADGTVRRWWSR